MSALPSVSFSVIAVCNQKKEVENEAQFDLSEKWEKMRKTAFILKIVILKSDWTILTRMTEIIPKIV